MIVAGLSAQEWQLPDRGAVEYRRRTSAAVSHLQRTAVAARRADLDGRLAERLLPTAAPAPWLCAGELSADRRRVTGPVRDLRDVLRGVAFDLRRGGGRGRFPALVPYGDLAVAGSWGRLRADGSQQMRATVRARRPADERLGAFCVRSCAGRLTLERRVDLERGIVESFAGELEVVIEEGARRYRRVRVTDAWKFVAVRDNRDVDFRLRVAAAIRAGAAFVRTALGESRSYLDGGVVDRRSYGSGRLALGLLTLLHADVAPDDAVVRAGFVELARRRLVDTYSLAVALMATAKLRSFRPLNEREQRSAARWFDKLVRNVDPRPDPADLLRFNYVRAPRYDNSVQQYGLLGLVATQDCGIPVDGALFAAAARHLLAVQCPSSGGRTHRVVTSSDLAAAGADEPRVQAERSTCRGFGYIDADEPPFGSMSAAGISALLLARAGMARAEHRDRGLERGIDRGVRDGFGWIARELSLRCNPGFGERGRFHWYYWLYCLERSCELAGIARLDDRDWYYEGALQLIAQQQPSGAFRSGGGTTMQIDATCFSILFLAKATAKAAVTRSGG